MKNKILASDRRIILMFITIVLLSIFTGTGCQAIEITGDVYVRRIDIDHSQILTTAEIKNITDDYTDRKVTIDELKELASRINQLYQSKGYITARAILPVQKIKDGIVMIRLVEGHIGKIILTGNEETKNSYILKRIAIKPEDMVTLDELKDKLFYFNATNDIDIKARLKEGQDFGTTDLKLNVKEPKKVRYSLFADNAGRDETGLYRYGINITNNSLFGYRDNLSLTVISAEGIKAGTLSYSIPVGKRGSRLSLTYNKNGTSIISGDFGSIDIEGNYREYGLEFKRPLIIKRGFELKGAVDYHLKESDTRFSGVELLNTDVKTFGLNLTSRRNKKDNIWYTSNSLLKGIANSEKKDFKDPGTSETFLKYRGYFENQRKLRDNSILSLKSMIQLSKNKLLPSSEQFILGGMSTVRGYEEGKLTGDQGYYLGIENTRRLTDKINYFIFLDNGGVYPYKGNDESINQNDYLTSAGLGLTVHFTRKISAKLEVGFPIGDEEQKKGRIHFSMQSSW